jgi:hypothetical protein
MADFSIVLYTSRLFGWSGEVQEWARNVTDYFDLWATNEAPIRTGELANSISHEVVRVGSHEVEMILSVGAEHAIYVLGGTKGIFVESGHYIPVGKQRAYGPGHPGGGYAKVVKVWGAPRGKGFVRGQEANNFIDAAYARTARRFPALAGMSITEL